MPNASRTVVINRPVEDVFGFLTTSSNDPMWRPQVKMIHGDGAPGVGRRIHQVIKGPGGRDVPADLEVTEYDVPHRYGFKVVAGPVRPQGEYVLASVPGGTQVTFTLSAELSGVKKILMSRAVQKSMDGEVAGLDTVKSLVEKG